MIRKTKKTIEEPKEEEAPREKLPKGGEESYFFPNERITIKATSMEEARRKLKEIKK